jgi:hypothetical protein
MIAAIGEIAPGLQNDYPLFRFLSELHPQQQWAFQSFTLFRQVRSLRTSVLRSKSHIAGVNRMEDTGNITQQQRAI